MDASLPDNAALHRLRRVLFLKVLTDDQLHTLARHVHVRTYPPGARLILEGTYGSTLFIIDEGMVEVYKGGYWERVVLAHRGTGSILGEMALMDSGQRAATVRTTMRCWVLEIDKPAFEAILAEHPSIAAYVLQEMNKRLRWADNRMVGDLLRVNTDLLRAQRRIEETYDTTLAALCSALDLRDTETEGHSRRVAEYASLIGQALHLTQGELKALHRGALLHDIGKIGVPDAILRKAGPLTGEEWVLMRQHPAWGAAILQDIPFLHDTLSVVRHHHEWWNGQGYPDGLRGEHIPLSARIFAVADTFDALTTQRPYRPGISPEEALEVLRQEAGQHLDPHIVQHFEALFPTTFGPMCRRFQHQQPRLSTFSPPPPYRD